MTGGLLQLSAIGNQDIILTGNPQITYFKNVYKRYTNFSIESKPNLFTGEAKFGDTIECIINKSGDLLRDMYIEIELPTLKQNQTHNSTTSNYVGYVNGVANALIESVELQIGRQTIDKYFSDWSDIHSELHMSESKKKLYNRMIGYFNTEGTLEKNAISHTSKTKFKRFYIPLYFWFNRNPGLSLPLIALQYHEVSLIIKLRNINEIVKSDIALGNQILDTEGNIARINKCIVWSDYIFLDTKERRIFAQSSHEYLIEQTQYTEKEISGENTNIFVDLHFNHPVKSLYWIIIRNENLEINTKTGNSIFKYSSKELSDTFDQCKLLLEGMDRFGARSADYFRTIQPYNHFKRGPNKYLYTYSFSLDANNYQPNGTCNFSRLESPQLSFTFDKDRGLDEGPRKIKIYAVNYNLLKITSGMAGLAYSN